MKIILGASGTTQEGWISTERQELNVTDEASFFRYFKGKKAEAFLAEHVWEHLTPENAFAAAGICRKYLEPGGRLRIAVPDGLKPDPAYIEGVRPGGNGAGADDHQVLYDHVMLRSMLTMAGFARIILLEWWDEGGLFHMKPWDAADGLVRRSSKNDARNHGTQKLCYTSLIVDAIKGLS